MKKRTKKRNLMSELASRVAIHEGKSHQATIGDVREILAIVSVELAKDSEVLFALLANGNRLLKRKAN